MSEAIYSVSGMTCGHCATAVSRELLAVTGVTGVDVDVDAGQVKVTSEQALTEDEVRAAVTEAGFALLG